MNMYTDPDLSNQVIEIFSPNSRRMTFTALDENQQMVVIDGEE